jgi:hypothetical protein
MSTQAWRCHHCAFRTLDEDNAMRHAFLFPNHAVVRRYAFHPDRKSWVCEACPYETDEELHAQDHQIEKGGEHVCVLAGHAKTHPERPEATPQNTGPGAMLTDGETLYEVKDCRRKQIKAGRRRLTVPERRLVDAAADELDDIEPGAWVPMPEVLALRVVKAVTYEEPQDQPAAA